MNKKHREAITEGAKREAAREASYRQGEKEASKADLSKGEYHAEYDEDTASFCVFHTEHSKAVGSHSSMDQAKEDADRRNKGLMSKVVQDRLRANQDRDLAFIRGR